jgi:hypothetical protein
MLPKSITIISHNELLNVKGLKAKHMIFVSLFHSNDGETKKDKMINSGLQKTSQKTED